MLATVDSRPAIWAMPHGKGWVIVAAGGDQGRFNELVRDAVYNLSKLDLTKPDALEVDMDWDGVYVIVSGSKNEPLDNQEMTDHENLYPFLSYMEKRLPVRRGRLGRSDGDRDSLGSVPRAGARREVNG